MKIKRIEVKNFKAIGEQIVDFNGCSAIITAANDKGKTSLLRGLIDRFRSEKPEIIVKEGEAKGYNTVELTDGSLIEWKFTQKTETFAFTTKDGIRQTQGVLGTIGEKYFGSKFDIDGFLRSGPKAQEKELQKIVGLDFTAIDQQYAEAYTERTTANRKLKELLAKKKEKPTPVEKPNIQSIKDEISKIENHNREYREMLDEADKLEHIVAQVEQLIKGTKLESLFSYAQAIEQIEILRQVESKITDIAPVNKRLEDAYEQQRAYDSYERDLEDYNEWVADGKKARAEAEAADKLVKDIEAEKADMIATADMPMEFEFGPDGLLYRGLPLDENQISQSARYIAALKLGAMMIGDVRTLHFDASSLDNENLKNVQFWAENNDLQLLIERPDYDGGEIKYQIVASDTQS